VGEPHWCEESLLAAVCREVIILIWVAVAYLQVDLLLVIVVDYFSAKDWLAKGWSVRCVVGLSTIDLY